MNARRLAVPVLAGALCAPALFASALLSQSVQYGVTQSHDTVTVGQPFEIRVRVRAPAGATIQFPENPDTAGTIQARDPRTIYTSDSVQTLDQMASYYVAAWDVDSQTVRLADVVITHEGVATRVPLDAVTVFVRSVLPADSALRVPKPARPLWETRPFPWWLLALVVAALALGFLLWWWLRRRRRPPAPVVVDPYVRAIRELNRIDAMGLVDAGERTRFVALVVEVLRDYLAARYGDATLALTSRELVAVLRRNPHIPHERLSRALHEADLAKFARFGLTEERARSLARDAREIVEHEHQASQPSIDPTEKAA